MLLSAQNVFLTKNNSVVIGDLWVVSADSAHPFAFNEWKKDKKPLPLCPPECVATPFTAQTATLWGAMTVLEVLDALTASKYVPGLMLQQRSTMSAQTYGEEYSKFAQNLKSRTIPSELSDVAWNLLIDCVQGSIITFSFLRFSSTRTQTFFIKSH